MPQLQNQRGHKSALLWAHSLTAPIYVYQREEVRSNIPVQAAPSCTAVVPAATAALSLALCRHTQSGAGPLLHADVHKSSCSNPGAVCTICNCFLDVAEAFHLKCLSQTQALRDLHSSMLVFCGGAGPRQAQTHSRLMESTFQTSPV